MPLTVIFAILSIILVFVGYVPYVRDIFKKKTTPHAFTFFIWGLSTSTAYFLQVKGGGGIGSYVTLAGGLFCIFIFFLGLKYGHKDITRSDIVFLVLALLALFLWFVVDQPVWANILIVLVDVLGFIPTVRKSWNAPYSETLSTYVVYVFRHGLAIFALSQFNILTVLFPATLVVANAFTVIYLLVRRRRIPAPPVTA